MSLHAAFAWPTSPRLADPPTILIVDDLEDHRELLGLLLSGAGYPVTTAADGEAALAAIERARPRIALLDIGLPVVDGYEVARRIRARHGAAVYLVAVTGYGREEDRRRALAAGFDEHLVKPLAPALLMSLIDRAGRTSSTG